MGKIKTPTDLAFWDFNDTSASIWFSTSRLIKRAKQLTNIYTEPVVNKNLRFFLHRFGRKD